MPPEKKSDIEIKWLTGDYWETYRDLRLEAIRRAPSAFGSAFVEEKDLPESTWRERTGNTLFAFVNGIPVGLIGHFRLPRVKQNHIVHIVGFYLKEEYRGRGIGDELLRVLLERIRSYDGVTKITLAVNSTQVAASRIYQKHGFEVVGKLKKELKDGDTYYDQVLMDKLL